MQALPAVHASNKRRRSRCNRDLFRCLLLNIILCSEATHRNTTHPLCWLPCPSPEHFWADRNPQLQQICTIIARSRTTSRLCLVDDISISGLITSGSPDFHAWFGSAAMHALDLRRRVCSRTRSASCGVSVLHPDSYG